MSRRLGLIVGVNHYQDITFQPLRYAELDARALAQWLVNTKGGQWSPADVQHVQGSYVTKELVESLVSQMCLQMASSDDLALIYFAGQAFVDERSGDGYLALADTFYQQPQTALHLPSLAQHVLNRSRAAQILLILDCFQTGPAWNKGRMNPYDSKPLIGSNFLETLQQHPNRLVLCSCRGNERAPEVGEHNLGSFTHRMIVGFCGPAVDPTTKTATLQQLHSYLFNALDEQHRPQLFGTSQAPLVLVGNPPTPVQPVIQKAPVTTSTLSSQGAQTRQTTSTFSSSATISPPLPTGHSAPFHPPTGPLTTPPEQQCQQFVSQAQQSIQQQGYPEALNLLDKALLIQPEYLPALTLKAQLLGTLNRFQEALAIVDHILQKDQQNPLAWSMHAVLLNNTGQYQAALSSVERSLELDSTNPETYGIKNNIMASMAMSQSNAARSSARLQAVNVHRESKPRALASSLLLEILGFFIALVGMLIPILLPRLPILVGLSIGSLGLAILCGCAFRATYRQGLALLFPNLFITGIAAALLGGFYKFGDRIFAKLPTTMNPASLALFVLCVLAAAVLPWLLGILGFISGFRYRARTRASS